MFVVIFYFGDFEFFPWKETEREEREGERESGNEKKNHIISSLLDFEVHVLTVAIPMRENFGTKLWFLFLGFLQHKKKRKKKNKKSKTEEEKKTNCKMNYSYSC